MSSTDSDVFTFLSVYYKHGEYSSKSFKTLREGLHKFLNEYLTGAEEHEVGIRRQQLEGLTDEDLLTEMLKLGGCDPISCMNFFHTVCVLGTERIGAQRGHGLVAVVKGPRSDPGPGPCVYLEVSYKHGEWKVKEWISDYISNAMDEIEREKERGGNLDEWESMSDEEREDLALKRCQENVDNQLGWGAVLRVPGTLVDSAER
jgi:hypothetical protein